MKKIGLFLLLGFSLSWLVSACQERQQERRKEVPLDSIVLSDPCILADRKTAMYYMTGTGGMLWKSKDLKLWEGPFHVAKTDSGSWMGPKPMIWAAELHPYKGKYYYFATFTNQAVKIDTVQGNVIERRASGTIEKIELKPDLSGTIGEGKLLFRASESPWSREKDADGKDKPNKVTDGPYLFRTGTGRLGMIWTSWIYNVYTQGVAYSESGTLDGPWIQEKDPITPPNFGHGMLFQTLDGKWLMSVHSHKDVNGRYIRTPRLFEVDFSGDKLVVGKPYIP